MDENAMDRLRIEDLAKRYARGIDARDWSAVDSCFTPTARVHGTTFSGPYPEYITSLRSVVESFQTTMHFFGTQLAEVNGDKGQLTTYGIAFHLGGGPGGKDFVIGVRYLDDVARTDDGWLIQERVVEGIWRRPLGDETQDLTKGVTTSHRDRACVGPQDLTGVGTPRGRRQVQHGEGDVLGVDDPVQRRSSPGHHAGSRPGPPGTPTG